MIITNGNILYLELTDVVDSNVDLLVSICRQIKAGAIVDSNVVRIAFRPECQKEIDLAEVVIFRHHKIFGATGVLIKNKY